MKPAKFRLESVLHLYATREDEAKASLGNAVRAREFIDESLAAARVSVDSHVDGYSRHRSGGGFSAESHARHWAAIQEGQAACKALEVRRTAALHTEAQARSVLVEARRQHEMMLKLRARHVETQRLEALRHEEHSLADIFNSTRARRLRDASLEAFA